MVEKSGTLPFVLVIPTGHIFNCTRCINLSLMLLSFLIQCGCLFNSRLTPLPQDLFELLYHLTGVVLLGGFIFRRTLLILALRVVLQIFFKLIVILLKWVTWVITTCYQKLIVIILAILILSTARMRRSHIVVVLTEGLLVILFKLLLLLEPLVMWKVHRMVIGILLSWCPVENYKGGALIVCEVHGCVGIWKFSCCH